MRTRDYVCNQCARSSARMPRVAVGPLRGTAQQSKWMTIHTGSTPTKPLNGVFFSSDTNTLRVMLDDAGAQGVLEEESGSTNVVIRFSSSVGLMEAAGIPFEDADGLRWVRSSNADEPHFYPISIEPLRGETCRVCGARVFP